MNYRKSFLQATLTSGLLLPLASTLASEPMALGEERFKINLGGFFTDFDTGMTIGVDSAEGRQEIDMEGDLGMDSSHEAFRLDGYWRFAPRHRLFFGYYELNRSGHKILETEIEWEDTVYPVGTEVETSFDWSVIPVSYAYSFYQTPKWEAAASIGVHWLSLEASIAATANSQGNVIGDVAERSGTEGPMPVVGLRLDYQPNRKWLLGGHIEYFSIDTGKYDGSLADIGLTAEYLIDHTWSVGIGYNHFEIDVNVDEDDWDGNINYGYNGLQAFLSARF